MSEGHLQEQNDSKTAASLKPTPAWVTAHESWGLTTHCTACRQLKRLKKILSRCLSCSRGIFGDWSDIKVFCSLSYLRCLCSSAPSVRQRDSQLSAYSGREGPRGASQFRDFPFEMFTWNSSLKSSPAG